MNNHPSTDTKNKSTEPPAPELLRVQTDNKSSESETSTAAASAPRAALRPRHATYRPSHKATFVGLAVVAVILAANAGIIIYLMNTQVQNEQKTTQGEVTISSDVLDTLGVSRNPVGNSNTELVVSPNSTFKGKVTVGGDVSVAGQFNLSSKFSAGDASITKLEAGDTTLSQVNISGDGTVSNMNLRNNLIVAGSSSLQGPVTMSQLLTVNNNVNIIGNLAVGGTLSARGFQASSLVSDTTLTIGGHVITRGVAPGVGPGPALGSNGTISISGNDASGTVAINIGVGGGNGIVAYVAFINQYSNIPHVVITAVGHVTGSAYVNRDANGFSIGINGSLAPGGYAFDYIVMQ